MDLTLEHNDMFNWGMMIALEERIVTVLAVMNDVNAYDQPGVQDGKLAADAVNALSKRVVSTMPAAFAGTAEDYAHAVLRDSAVNVVDLDGILSDLEANHGVKDAYPTIRLSSAKREFVNGRFHYEFAKL
eukprot:EC789914.1.p2 GENE.EC789914.1~~EC789914.1.p2  ORF type:complete len:130 (+),score=57.32 EC789914.1:69-458(+)